MASIVKPSKQELEESRRWAFHRSANMQFDTLAAIGYLDGVYPVSYGSSLDGATSTDGEIAFREAPELAYGADLSADTIYLVSSSGSDTQTYSIQGIDANGDYATTTVTATGTTPAVLSGTWNHIQRCVCTDGVANVGFVYTSTKSGAGVPSTTGDQIQTVMAPGDNYAINPELIVPNDQIVTLHAFDFSQDVSQSATIKILANRQGRWILNFKFYAGANSDNFEQVFFTPLRLFAGDRMRVTFEASGGSSAKATFGMNGNVLDVTNLDVTKVGIGEIFR